MPERDPYYLYNYSGPPPFARSPIFFKELKGYTKFAFFFILLIILIISLLWNLQPWFKLRVERNGASIKIERTEQDTHSGRIQIGEEERLTERYITHIVRSGDTLSKIAEHYDVDLSTLLHYNQITNPHLIYPGQKLKIPQ